MARIRRTARHGLEVLVLAFWNPRVYSALEGAGVDVRLLRHTCLGGRTWSIDPRGSAGSGLLPGGW